jgi:Fe-coproporphyrin III synthase
MLQSHYLFFLRHNIKSRIFGIKQPLLAGFKITNRCNLKCKSCPFWKKDKKNISFDRAIDVLDKLSDAGVRLLIFEGGEPFIWKDGNYQLEDLVTYAKKKFFRVGITTNGTLPLKSESDIIWVSIDGLKKKHELNRGKSFDKIMANIETSSHPNLLANITITKLNWLEIPELVKYLETKVRGITVQFYYPFPNTTDLSLETTNRIKVLDELIRLKSEGYNILDSIDALQALKMNTWRCHDWLIASAEPDGKMNIGCYLKNRAEISCADCGFAAHTEISLAYDWNWGAIAVGKKTFDFRVI